MTISPQFRHSHAGKRGQIRRSPIIIESAGIAAIAVVVDRGTTAIETVDAAFDRLTAFGNPRRGFQI